MGVMKRGFGNRHTGIEGITKGVVSAESAIWVVGRAKNLTVVPTSSFSTGFDFCPCAREVTQALPYPILQQTRAHGLAQSSFNSHAHGIPFERGLIFVHAYGNLT